MKTLEELGISPTPWAASNLDIITSDCGIPIAFACGDEKHDRRNGYDNARLAAAAPELYEALREIYETVEGENVHFTGASAWFERARAALEKAGGAE